MRYASMLTRLVRADRLGVPHDNSGKGGLNNKESQWHDHHQRRGTQGVLEQRGGWRCPHVVNLNFPCPGFDGFARAPLHHADAFKNGRSIMPGRKGQVGCYHTCNLGITPTCILPQSDWEAW